MAMKKLVEGECGGSNALLQLASHFSEDQALSQEKFTQSYQPLDPLLDRDEKNEFVSEFLNDRQVTASLQVSAPQSFHMSTLLQEMQEIERKTNISPAMGPGVAELTKSHKWAEEYLCEEDEMQSFKKSVYSPAPMITSDVSEPLKYAQEYLEMIDHHNDELKMINDQSQKALPDSAKNLYESVHDSMIKESEFMNFVKKIKNEDIVLEDGNFVEKNHSSSFVDEFLSSDLTLEKNLSADTELEKVWDEEGSKEISSQIGDTDSDYWVKLQNEWETLVKQEPEHPWLSQLDDSNELYKEYNFTEKNQLLDYSNPFEEGLKRLKEHDLPSAVLLFEAAVQKDPKNSQAWYYLGTTQAENEQDTASIAALKKCLDLEPRNLNCMLSLAVSYTNESMQTQACHILQQWIKNHSVYSRLADGQPSSNASNFNNSLTSSIMTKDLHQEVTNLFLKAAQISPSNIDGDVQSCLGVLFNLSGEHDKAVDCFNTALHIKPNDSRLWNRLGATLANGNRSEEAVNAYTEALKLSPGFIRCRYNLGVSCINLGSYREAIEHLLTALNIQASAQSNSEKSSQSVMSDNIWSTLRLVLGLSDRSDLFTLVDSRNVSQLNNILISSDS